MSGFAAADALLERGADVTVVDGGAAGPRARRRPSGPGSSTSSGHACVLGPGPVTAMPDGPVPDLVVTSPGWRPDQPLLAAAAAAGIPVWGEVELAWRMRPAVGRRALAHRDRHQRQDHDGADARPRSCGPPGCERPRPATSARRSSRRCCTPSPTTSSPSSCRASSCTGRTRSRRSASACLNIAPDHVDWHGSLEEYAAGQGQGLRPTPGRLRLQRRRTSSTEQLVEDAEVQEGCRAIGFTLGAPGAVDGRGRRRRARRPGLRRGQRKTGGSRAAPRSTTCAAARRRSRRTRSPTPSRRPPWPGRTASRPSRSAPGCAPSAPTRTASPRSARSTASATSTTPRPPTRTPPAPACTPTSTSSGSPAGCSRGPTSTTWSPAPSTGCAAWSSSAATAPGSPRHSPDTRRMSRSSTSTAPTLGPWTCRRARRARSPQSGDVVLLAPAAASMDMFADYGARGDAFAAAVATGSPRGSSR